MVGAVGAGVAEGEGKGAEERVCAVLLLPRAVPKHYDKQAEESDASAEEGDSSGTGGQGRGGLL